MGAADLLSDLGATDEHAAAVLTNQPAIADQVVDHCSKGRAGDVEFGRQLSLGRNRLTDRS
jgi:hypothetical protein